MHKPTIPILTQWFALTAICIYASVAMCGEPLAAWDFTKDLQGWTANPFVSNVQHSSDGLTMDVKSPDPFLTSPPVNSPAGQFLVVTLRMRSTGNTNGQLYFGQEFSEGNSRNFSVKNDGQWHDYRISIPSPGHRIHFRLDPSNTDGKVTLAWMRVEAYAELPNDPWASPGELRNKKFIGGGLYTVYGEETAITPRFLATHPEFVETYPFDGIVLPASLSQEWTGKLGFTKLGNPLRPSFLHELLWNTVCIPDEAVAQTLPIELSGGMQTGETYRIVLDYTAENRDLSATLTALSQPAGKAIRVQQHLPDAAGQIAVNELGVAISEEFQGNLTA